MKCDVFCVNIELERVDMKGKYKYRKKNGLIKNAVDSSDIIANNETIRTRWNNGFYTWSHRADKTFDPSWFFGVRGNIFSVDFDHTRKVLISEMKKMHDTLVFLNNNSEYNKQNLERFMRKHNKSWDNLSQDQKDEFMKKFTKNVEDKLEYLLYCCYVVELKTNVGMFEYCPPFHGPVLQYALKNRAKNFENYKKLFEYQMQIEGHSLYVQDDITLKNIIEENFGTAVRSNTNFLIDDVVQHDLLRNVKKTPLTQFSHQRESDNHIYNLRYYIGEYQGKNVLFVETIKKHKGERHLGKKFKDDLIYVAPNVQKPEPPKMGYQLSVVLDGNPKHTRLLYRMDINPTANHINKLTEDGMPRIAVNSSENSEYIRKINVQPCHVHNPSVRYSVFFPNYTHSSEATETQMVFLNSDEVIDFNRAYLNVDTQKYLIPKNVQTQIKTQSKQDKINLNRVLSKGEVYVNE